MSKETPQEIEKNFLKFRNEFFKKTITGDTHTDKILTKFHRLYESVLDERLLYKYYYEKTLKQLNKEKEKNKELENADLTTVYLDGVYDGEKRWKDNIRSKIEESKEIRKIYEKGNMKFDIIKMDYIITVLLELLEE